MHLRGAFTYIELMIVIVVAAILTMVAITETESAAGTQAQLAAEQFAADVAYARSLAISDPDSTNPVIIKVDTDSNSYWIARKTTEDTPILHPETGEPYVISFGDGAFDRVTIIGSDFDGSSILEFDSFGGTTQSDDGVLQMKAGDARIEVTIATSAADAVITEGFTKSLTSLETGTTPVGGGAVGGTLPASATKVGGGKATGTIVGG